MVASTFPIGELARRTGTPPSTLRYYDDLGLVEPAGRVSGRRYYDQAAVDRVGVVATLQEAGFTLGEIRRLLDGGDDWRPLAAAKAEELDRRLTELGRARAMVAAALACGCEHLESCGRLPHLSAATTAATDRTDATTSGDAEHAPTTVSRAPR